MYPNLDPDKGQTRGSEATRTITHDPKGSRTYRLAGWPTRRPVVVGNSVAGFAFDFIFACISHWVVDGMGFQTIMPLIILAILVTSYVCYHKIYGDRQLA